jgi:hypothetical protein
MLKYRQTREKEECKNLDADEVDLRREDACSEDHEKKEEQLI